MRSPRLIDLATGAFRLALAVGLTAFSACFNHAKVSALTAEQSIAVTNSVREFAATVASDVTKRGPLAWLDHFANTPAFFMVVDGQVAFQNGAAAVRGIQELPSKIARIELRWGDSIRVDPLTPTLAMVATVWHEVIVDPAGRKTEQGGYFTGLAELGPTGWRFRDANWTVVNSPSPVQ